MWSGASGLSHKSGHKSFTHASPLQIKAETEREEIDRSRSISTGKRGIKIDGKETMSRVRVASELSDHSPIGMNDGKKNNRHTPIGLLIMGTSIDGPMFNGHPSPTDETVEFE